jgi:hypothetical protein
MNSKNKSHKPTLRFGLRRTHIREFPCVGFVVSGNALAGGKGSAEAMFLNVLQTVSFAFSTFFK